MNSLASSHDLSAPAVTENAPFHIAFCVDNNYFRAMGATIASIVDNNRGTRFVFHVFAFSIADDHRHRLQELERRFGMKVELHLLDEKDFAQFTHFIKFSYYSLSIFSRLIIPDALRGVTDKVLYLDADILCAGNIDELIAMDISNEIAVVVPDAEETTRRRCAALELKHGKYFNGGVLYMNVENWIKNNITEAAVKALVEYGKKLRFNDQDALNIVLDGRAKFVAKKWNYIYDLVYDLDHNITKMRPLDDPGFIHFAGAVKPWADWSGHDSRQMFIQYHALSPWSDFPLDPAPGNTKEMRMLSRFLLKRGKILDSARWYYKYLHARSKKR
jgi:UDP-glucose:(glucosyl)LPS alpha-1,3-glucosyltransferase